MSQTELRECYQKLEGTPLTNLISEDDFVQVCETHEVHLKHCQPGENILSLDSPHDTVIVVVTGRLQAVHEDFCGTRFIIKTAGPGEALSFTFSQVENDNLSYFAEAASTNTTIMLLNLKKFTQTWPTKKPESTFLKNIVLFMLTAHHTTYQHLIDLSKRTTREKLMSFLFNTALLQQSNRFEIKLSRQELADYLCVDRSAMSTELTKLKKAGFMDYVGNHFSLNSDLMKYL